MQKDSHPAVMKGILDFDLSTLKSNTRPRQVSSKAQSVINAIQEDAHDLVLQGIRNFDKGKLKSAAQSDKTFTPPATSQVGPRFGSQA